MPQFPAPSPEVPLLRVVQCNILHGGWPYEVRGKQLFVNRDDRWVGLEKDFTLLSYAPDRPARDDPGTAFSRQMQTLGPAVIGTQEVDSGDVDRLRRLLGPDWRYTPPLDGNAACCIFWHSATVTATGPPEVFITQRFRNPEGKIIPLRILKQVFTHNESGKTVAVVTGKSWYQGTTNDRRIRAVNTRNFARRGNHTTVIAIDMSPPGTAAFAAMKPFVARGAEKTCPTGIFLGRQGKPALRTDHIFYFSPHLRGPQAGGIVRCVTGSAFGSDHRYVWADVKLP